MKDGLQLLKAHLKPYGVRDLVYAFMLYEKSYVRGDYLFYGTFPDKIRQAYEDGGSGASFKYGEVLSHLIEPIFVDINALLDVSNPLHSYNSCTKMILDLGYTNAWIVPLPHEKVGGYGFLMLFQDNQPGAATIDINQLEQYGHLYHMTMHRHKQMATHFDLSKKQSTALASVAKGQTAGDIAEQTGLVERSIELRLQQGRKKLSARTTTEAVYKALAYGILPLQPGTS